MVIREVLQRRQEPWRWEAQWQVTESQQQRNERLIEADPLITTREFTKELNVTHSVVVWHLKQIEKVKNLNQWIPLELTKNFFKKLSFRNVFSYVYPTTMNHFLTGLWHVMKSGFYTTGNNQLSGWTEKLQSNSQSQTCTKKRSQALFGGLVPVWSTTVPESQWNHCIWEVCSANWWDAPKTAMPAASICSVERTQVFSATMPDCISHEQCFKSWMNWATEFCLIHHIHLPSINWLPLLQAVLTTFCRENPSTASSWQKMFSKSLSNPKAQIFLHYKNKQTYFLLAKMCWL